MKKAILEIRSLSVLVVDKNPETRGFLENSLMSSGFPMTIFWEENEAGALERIDNYNKGFDFIFVNANVSLNTEKFVRIIKAISPASWIILATEKTRPAPKTLAEMAKFTLKRPFHPKTVTAILQSSLN